MWDSKTKHQMNAFPALNAFSAIFYKRDTFVVCNIMRLKLLKSW